MSVLVFDFGLKHVGVAVAEKSENFSFALTTLPAKVGKVDSETLEPLFAQWRPEGVVVGLPFNMDGSESELVPAVRKFGKHLAETFDVNVSFVDERLSTYEAGQRTDETKPDHAVAAQVIAETWLQENAKNS